MIAFTGSKEVGIRIYELASTVRPGQIFLKRVIAEMEGKDPIIVDSSAKIDERGQDCKEGLKIIERLGERYNSANKRIKKVIGDAGYERKKI